MAGAGWGTCPLCSSRSTFHTATPKHPRVAKQSTGTRGVGWLGGRRWFGGKGFGGSWDLKRKSAASELESEPESEVGESDKHLWEHYSRKEAGHEENAANPETIRHLIGLRNWSLNGMVGIELEFLAPEIEGLWRQILEEDLRISSLPQSLKLLDSMDPEQKGEEFSRTVEDPAPTDSGYPRMYLETREYSSNVFRRLHVNLSVRQDGVEIIHIMMVPFVEYNIPIFTLQMVGVDDAITYCMLDLIPVSLSRELPEEFDTGMRKLRKGIECNREIPEWLERIGSKNTLLLVPKDEDEAMRFIAYAGLLAKAYLWTSKDMGPTGPSQTPEIRAVHERFHKAAIKNTKSRELLKMSFKEEEFLEEYFGKVLHDMTRNTNRDGGCPFL